MKEGENRQASDKKTVANTIWPEQIKKKKCGTEGNSSALMKWVWRELKNDKKKIHVA